MRTYYVYILASQPRGTLYIGVTNDLARRIMQHKNEKVDGFTKKYEVKQLVFFEEYPSIQDALTREKKLKKWNRDWKISLIEERNPLWIDLSEKC